MYSFLALTMSVSLEELLHVLDQKKQKLENRMLHIGEVPESEYASALLEYDSILLKISQLST
jgi:tRNA isopentenyl-2-thiomethyl-A-37 hydroxylase MiaE